MVVYEYCVPTHTPSKADLSASLNDLDQWVSVLGEKANASAAATVGFKQAMANLGNVGFAFGGGCFYGHGVRVSHGDARFQICSQIDSCFDHRRANEVRSFPNSTRVDLCC